MGLDITEQVEQRRQSAELERRLEAGGRIGQIGIWWRDPLGGQGQWNAQMFELSGRDPALGTPTLEQWSQASSTPTTASACASRRA